MTVHVSDHAFCAAVSLAVIMVMSACDADRALPEPTAAHYDCAGLPLAVKWSTDRTTVFTPSGSRVLPRAISAFGARYAANGHELWEHQGILRWTRKGEEPRTCVPRRGQP